MIKKLIPIFFLIFIQNVYGNWLLIDDQKVTKHFIDVETIKTNGSIKKVWTHQEYIEPQKGIKSSLLQVEFDCEKQQFHPLYGKSFRELNLEGKSIEDDLSKKTSWKKISKTDDKEFNSYYVFSCFYKPTKTNWVLINRLKKVDQYVDYDTLKRDGNVVTFQEYVNQTIEPQLDGSLSLQSLDIIDCKNETLTLTNLFTYKEKDLQGDLVYFSTYLSDPFKVTDNNYYYDFMKSVCK